MTPDQEIRAYALMAATPYVDKRSGAIEDVIAMAETLIPYIRDGAGGMLPKPPSYVYITKETEAEKAVRGTSAPTPAVAAPTRNPRAQELADAALAAATHEDLRKVWAAATDEGLMTCEVEVGPGYGPLGDWLTHRGNVLKNQPPVPVQSGQVVQLHPSAMDHPGSSLTTRNDLGL